MSLILSRCITLSLQRFAQSPKQNPPRKAVAFRGGSDCQKSKFTKYIAQADMRRRSDTAKTARGERAVLLGGAHEGDSWTQNPQVLRRTRSPPCEGYQSFDTLTRPGKRLLSGAGGCLWQADVIKFPASAVCPAYAFRRQCLRMRTPDGSPARCRGSG